MICVIKLYHLCRNMFKRPTMNRSHVYGCTCVVSGTHKKQRCALFWRNETTANNNREMDALYMYICASTPTPWNNYMKQYFVVVVVGFFHFLTVTAKLAIMRHEKLKLQSNHNGL